MAQLRLRRGAEGPGGAPDGAPDPSPAHETTVALAGKSGATNTAIKSAKVTTDALQFPAALAIACVCVDALSAYDPYDDRIRNIPSSMRITSLVLAICLASPPPEGSNRPVQLLILLILLAASSLSGTHEAGANMRAFDAIFVFIACHVAWQTIVRGIHGRLGHDTMVMADPASPSISMCLALIVYSGMRLARNGLMIAQEISTYKQLHVPLRDGSVVITDGCSMCNGLAAAASAGSGAAAAVAGAMILWRVAGRVEVEMAIVIHPLLAACCVLGIGAACSIVALAHTGTTLPSLFGEGACVGGTECDGARALRRFNTVSHNCAHMILLFVTVVTLVTSLSSARNALSANPEARRVASILLAVGAGYLMVVVVWYMDMSDVYSYTDLAMAVAVAGVVVAGLFDAVLGGQFIFAALLFEFASHVILHANNLSPLLSYFTIVSNLVMLAMYGLVLAIEAARMCYDRHGRRIDVAERRGLIHLENGLALLTTGGRSLALFLLLGTTGILASYEGGPTPTREGVNASQRSSFAFLLGHYGPYIAWTLVSTQHRQLGRGWSLYVAWTGSVFLALAVYGVCLLGTQSSSVPAEYPVSNPYLVIVTTVVLVVTPWYTAMK